MHLSVNGRSVVFSASDYVLFTLDTLDDRLSLYASRDEGPNRERVLWFVATGFSGVGDRRLDHVTGSEGVAGVHYWCSLALGQTVVYEPAGIAGDTLQVTAFDPATGHIEGEFRFRARPADGTVEGAEDVDVEGGHFEGWVVKVGDAGAAPPPARRR